MVGKCNIHTNHHNWRRRTPKPEDKWDENEMKRQYLNANAMNKLVCALSSDEYNRVCEL